MALVAILRRTRARNAKGEWADAVWMEWPNGKLTMEFDWEWSGDPPPYDQLIRIEDTDD